MHGTTTVKIVCVCIHIYIYICIYIYIYIYIYIVYMLVWSKNCYKASEKKVQAFSASFIQNLNTKLRICGMFYICLRGQCKIQQPE